MGHCLGLCARGRPRPQPRSGGARLNAPLVVVTFLLVFLVTSPSSSVTAATAASTSRPFIAIENIELIDVVQGKVSGPRTVLLGGGRIAAIIEPGTAVGLPSDAVAIDGRGKYLIPGLTDMHVHLFNNATHREPNDWMFPLFVANGVTGVREMNAIPANFAILKDWRAAREQGDLRAPRVVAAGMTISTDSSADVRRQVRLARSLKADFVKVFSDIGAAKWREVIEEAQLLDIPVCGHVPADVSAIDAARAGQRSNEHLTQLYEACAGGESKFLASRRNVSGKEAVRIRDAQERAGLVRLQSASVPAGRGCDRWN